MSVWTRDRSGYLLVGYEDLFFGRGVSYGDLFYSVDGYVVVRIAVGLIAGGLDSIGGT